MHTLLYIFLNCYFYFHWGTVDVQYYMISGVQHSDSQFLKILFHLVLISTLHPNFCGFSRDHLTFLGSVFFSPISFSVYLSKFTPSLFQLCVFFPQWHFLFLHTAFFFTLKQYLLSLPSHFHSETFHEARLCLPLVLIHAHSIDSWYMTLISSLYLLMGMDVFVLIFFFDYLLFMILVIFKKQVVKKEY